MSNTSITEIVNKNLQTRYKKEARFRRYGQLSIFIAVTFLTLFSLLALFQKDILLSIRLKFF